MTTTHDDDAAVDRNRLGRAVAARHLGGVAGRGGLGSVAAASLRFARGWGRPAVVRRRLSRPLPVAAGPTTTVPVPTAPLELRPPQWWSPPAEAEELPGRGLRRVVRRMPSEHGAPGSVPARLAPQTVAMRLPAEVDAVGRMTTPADSRSRRTSSRPPGARPAGGPPGNAEGVGSRSERSAGSRRAAQGPAPTNQGPAPTAPHPAPAVGSPRTNDDGALATSGSVGAGAASSGHSASSSIPSGPVSAPVVSRLLRRRALARLAREERARPVLATASATVARSVSPAASATARDSSPAGVDATKTDGARIVGTVTGDAETGSTRSDIDRAGLDAATEHPAAPTVSRAWAPGRTLRPLAGPVRRATRSLSAHQPLAAPAPAHRGRRAHGDIDAAGAPVTPAPPAHAGLEVRRALDADATSSSSHVTPGAQHGPPRPAVPTTRDGSAHPQPVQSTPTQSTQPAQSTQSAPSAQASTSNRGAEPTPAQRATSSGAAALAGSPGSSVTLPAHSTAGATAQAPSTGSSGARSSGTGAPGIEVPGVASTSAAPSGAGAGIAGALVRRSLLEGPAAHGAGRARRHALPGTGHRRPGALGHGAGLSLGSDAPGLRRLTAAPAQTSAAAPGLGGFAPRPSAAHGAAVGQPAAQPTGQPVRRAHVGTSSSTTSVSAESTSHAHLTSSAPAASASSGSSPAGTSSAGTPSAGTPSIRSVSSASAGAATTGGPPGTTARHLGELVPAAVRRHTTPRPGAAPALGPVTESAGAGPVGAALRALAPVTVAAAGPGSTGRPDRLAVPSGPVVRRWNTTRPRVAEASSAPLLGRARTGATGAGTAGAAVVGAAVAAAAGGIAAPPRPTTPRPTGLPSVRSWAAAPPPGAGAGPARAPASDTSSPVGARPGLLGGHRPPPVPGVAAGGPTHFPPPAGASAPGAPRTEGDAVRPSLWSPDPTTAPDSEVLASQVQQRVLARLEEWIASDLDDRVLELVERRMSEETERRAWRLGTEVF
ncbi:MAG: hypothetical protein GX593_05955 [Actinomycetales bacterium]|nr:hypothetical protein [Actinomycetales bacterium]